VTKAHCYRHIDRHVALYYRRDIRDIATGEAAATIATIAKSQHYPALFPRQDRCGPRVATNRSRGSAMVQTRKDRFVIAFERGKRLIQKGTLPDWFQKTDCYTQSKDRGDQYKLPHGQLLELALALYLASTGEPPLPSKAVREAFDDARSHLESAHKHLLLLSDVDVMPRTSDQEPLPDGGVDVTLYPSPVEEFLDKIDGFLARLKQARDKWNSKTGRAFSYLRYALLLLDAMIEKHNPRLSLQRREKLCEELFDEVRERAAGAGAESSTGYRDLLKRIAQARRSKRRLIV
jgi:hypothetical protein